MESITDINTKAICERKALQFAMTLILNKNKFTTIQEITSLVKNFDWYKIYIYTILFTVLIFHLELVMFIRWMDGVCKTFWTNVGIAKQE